ncbi:MAG: YciI family protein [Actinomycetota bacterium]
MKYLLLICVDPSLEPDEEPGEIEGWLDRLGDSRLIGNALLGARSAATVRIRRSKRLVTDGPFAETKEIIAGFDVIDCETRQEAIDIAAAHPVAKFGAVEVREFWED